MPEMQDFKEIVVTLCITVAVIWAGIGVAGLIRENHNRAQQGLKVCTDAGGVYLSTSGACVWSKKAIEK